MFSWLAVAFRARRSSLRSPGTKNAVWTGFTRRLVAGRIGFVSWFGGLALSAKAAIATAAFVTVSAGVVIGAPYTPTSMPWLPPAVAPSAYHQSPSPLKPSMVEAANPSAGTGSSAPRSTYKSTATAGAPTSAHSAAGSVATPPTTMGSATTTMPVQGKPTDKATNAPETSASEYYKSCAEAVKSGAAPITSGQPGYRIGLDSNHNGVACE